MPLFLGGREEGKENLPNKLLKHVAAEADNSIYSRMTPNMNWEVRNGRIIQQLIDDDLYTEGM